MLRRAFAFAAALFLVLPSVAQVQRSFPATALRGVVVFGEAPEISLNGQAGRLAPGARIRDASNMVVTPSAVYGGRYVVHFTLDSYGLMKDVWILTAAEVANKPWPRTLPEQQAWTFDPAAQVWTKP